MPRKTTSDADWSGSQASFTIAESCQRCQSTPYSWNQTHPPFHASKHLLETTIIHALATLVTPPWTYAHTDLSASRPDLPAAWVKTPGYVERSVASVHVPSVSVKWMMSGCGTSFPHSKGGPASTQVLNYLITTILRKWQRNKIILTVRSRYHKLIVCQVGLTTCRTVCIGKKKNWSAHSQCSGKGFLSLFRWQETEKKRLTNHVCASCLHVSNT